jgi:prophage regulatory protein
VSNHTALPEAGFLRLKSIVGSSGLFPISKSTWWAGVKAGRFPKPIKLGPRITAWRVEDIRSLVDRGVQPLPTSNQVEAGKLGAPATLRVEERAGTKNEKLIIKTIDGAPHVPAEKPRLLVENCNPDETVARVRDVLADAGGLYDRGVPGEQRVAHPPTPLRWAASSKDRD